MTIDRDPEAPENDRSAADGPPVQGQVATASRRLPGFLRRSRKFWTLLLVGVIGIVALIAGAILLPSNATTAQPVTYSLDMESGAGIAVTQVALAFTPRADDEVQVTITGNEVAYRQGCKRTQKCDMTPARVTLTLYGEDMKITGCPPPVKCTQISASATRPAATNIKIIDLMQSSTAVIRAANVGVSQTDEMALAHLPATHADVGGGKFSLDVTYSVPDPRKYDWSIPPRITRNQTTWEQTVVPTQTLAQSAQAIQVEGLNHGAQKATETTYLVVGILFGIAGGALTTLVTEGLRKPESRGE